MTLELLWNSFGARWLRAVITPIQQPAVTRQKCPGVLDVSATLQSRLDKVSNLTGDSDYDHE